MQQLPQIVFLEQDSLGVPFVRPNTPHTWQAFAYSPADLVVERLQHADVAIINKVKMTADVLAQLPSLKLIAICATGTDNVDLAYCAQNNITVKNAVNYGPESVAEHVMACMLSLSRHLNDWQARVLDGSWSASRFFCLHTYPMRPLSAQTLAIVGSGAIGQATARFAKAFGMTVLHAERPDAQATRPGYTAFGEALAQADVVSLHCPLNDLTRGLFNTKTFGLMKPGAVLINTARGALVNFSDVLSALDSGHLGGAALDVLEVEPPPANHLMVTARHPRLLVTPHIAWATQEAQQNLVNIVKNNIDSFYLPAMGVQ